MLNTHDIRFGGLNAHRRANNAAHAALQRAARASGVRHIPRELQRMLHDEITHQGLDYHEIQAIAEDLFERKAGRHYYH